jgi:hypothetical protein
MMGDKELRGAEGNLGRRAPILGRVVVSVVRMRRMEKFDLLGLRNGVKLSAWK